MIDEGVPVIFLTARTDSESRDKGLEAGAVDYITKPYDRHELSIKVKNHLALYRGPQGDRTTQPDHGPGNGDGVAASALVIAASIPPQRKGDLFCGLCSYPPGERRFL